MVKILDFGLAKSAESSGASGVSSQTMSPTLSLAMTQAGMILGTAAYMSPEQARGKVVDRRTDIWAFGVVLYEIVTGKRLFEGEDLTETLAKVVRDRPDLSGVPANLRRLLERCLEKDPKKRLRDIGDMELLLGEAPAPAAPATTSTSGKLPWIVAALLAVAIAGLAVFALPHFREEPPRLTKLEFPPPEKGTLHQNGGPPAVSPDGRRVAFRADGEGKGMLWVRDLDSLNARMLAGTSNANEAFWAPDSRQLAFYSAGKLMKIDVTGGPATTITNISFLRGGAWNQDNVIVFALAGGGLLRVPAAGGTPSPATELDKSRHETGHLLPQFLPDGHHFLYAALSSEPEKSGLFVGDLKSKEKKLVVPVSTNARYVEPGYILCVRERTLMAQPFDAGKLETTGEAVPIAEQVDSVANYGYFDVSRNGTLAYASGGAGAGLQITWYDRSGKVVGTVGKPVEIQTPRLSPNGKMVATDRRDAQSPNHDIWLYDLLRGTEQRLTFAGNNTFPVWSPDGDRIAFKRVVPDQIVVKAADGTGAEEVLEEVYRLPMDWTRDGRYLVSATPNSHPKTGNDLWALPLSQGKPAGKPMPLRETEFNEWHGRVSPDGRWLAYDSDDTKRKESYVVGFPGPSGHWQISVAGGRYPVWSRDGRELYFYNAEASKMMAVEIKPGAQFQAGVPKPLFDVRLGTSNPTYDVSADGRFLIATPVEQAATVPMTVVLNWRQALKKWFCIGGNPLPYGHGSVTEVPKRALIRYPTEP